LVPSHLSLMCWLTCVLIPIDIYSAIIKLSTLFADMLLSHFAIIMHLYQLIVSFGGETCFTDKIKSHYPCCHKTMLPLSWPLHINFIPE
jgi:hypothetical protein